MTHAELQKFIAFLMKRGWTVFAPEKRPGEVVYAEVQDAAKVKLISEPPLHSFKRFLVPPEETLFEYEKDKLNEVRDAGIKIPKQVIFGINPVDLKAIVMLNQIFERDPWYQERMRRTLIIGQSLIPADVEHNIFQIKYEEDILEHLQFDIFLEVQPLTPARNASASVAGGPTLSPKGRGAEYFVYTGSEEGQSSLEDFGYEDYEHIAFAGPIREEGFDPMMVKYRDALRKTYKKEIWENDIGARCIECGKCTLICPTCFCFDMKDQPDLVGDGGVRKRAWSACFYNDFSEVAGGHKFLKTTAERIHFWYYHKFVRIPDQIQIMGCVGCGRCAKVCPVNINIFKVLAAL
ncbi:4Fe-4S dicluster domain-containing protein [Candidatus Falkowbacteria bacterium]|nr:4Fe-4S dicluster domain-containing protein [Candidatus Falkowbacteria bacterium]